MAQKFALSARSALMANISAAATSLLVDITKADLFPVANTGTDPIPTVGKDWFKIILEDTSYNKEIVYVRTRVSGDATMTQLLRGQEGTTARAFLAGGTIVGLRHTPADLGDAISFAGSASAFWKTMVGYANAALSRAALGASVVGDAIFTAADEAAGRTALGVKIGTDVQAYDAKTAKTDVAQTFTAQQTPMKGALTDGSTVDWNGNTNGQSVKLTTAAARTFNAPTNIIEDNLYVLRLTTGGFTPAWNAAYKWATVPSGLESATYTLSFIGGASNTLIPMGNPFKTGA